MTDRLAFSIHILRPGSDIHLGYVEARETAGMTGAVLPDHPGLWVPMWTSVRAIIPRSLRPSFDRQNFVWSPSVGCDVLKINLYSSVEKPLGTILAKLTITPRELRNALRSNILPAPVAKTDDDDLPF